MARIPDAEVLERFPDAPVDHDNVEYHRGILERRLLVNRCGTCGTWFQPPRGLCPSCWGEDVVPTPCSGKGVLHMLVLLHQGPVVDGVDYHVPYPVAVVELDEQAGLRVTATLADPGDRPDIGARVELTWIERCGVPVPAFQAAAA